MSHNVQISGVKINDLDALETAMAELRREGINVSLERGEPGTRVVRFRTYSGFGNNPMADHVIRLPGASYDIGLLKQPSGHYEPVYDNALGLSVACPIACEYKPGNQLNYRAITDRTELDLASRGIGIGKLMQRYTAVVAERDARLRGYVARRVTSNDGALQVVITV